MKNLIDARGLSCPQPVLVTVETLGKMGQGEVTVLVDTQTSKENVTRASASLGWQVKEVQRDGADYRLILEKR
jgi:tRNA 2-thiouridine synthesizing protein A